MIPEGQYAINVLYWFSENCRFEKGGYKLFQKLSPVAQAMFTCFSSLLFCCFFFQDLCKWRVWMPSGHQRLRGNWRFLSSFKTKVFKTLQLGKTSQSRDWSTKNTAGWDELYWGTRKLKEGREARWSNSQCAPEGRYGFKPLVEGGIIALSSCGMAVNSRSASLHTVTCKLLLISRRPYLNGCFITFCSI